MQESILGVSEFKSKCLGLLDEVAKGNTLVITKHGRPIAKVLPVSTTPKSLRGSWKGIVKIKGDIVKFNEAEAWENG
jgi:prevent-host-death family protein